jgi:hypothetical protein
LLAEWDAPGPAEPDPRAALGPRHQRKVLVLGVLAAVQLVAVTDLGLAAARYAGVVSGHRASGSSTTATTAPADPGSAPPGLVAAATSPGPRLLTGAATTVPLAATASTATAPSAKVASAVRSRSKVTSTAARRRR